MWTNKDYCDYETCVALKDFGYVGSRQECECFGAYFNFGNDIFTDSLDNTEVGANEYLRVPLYLAQKWLREEKGIIVGIINNFTTHEFDFYVSTWDEDRCRGNKYSSYEDALQRGIKEAVKLLKEKK